MASTTATTPDTLVTIKVTYDGTTRRFKLPLRDLGASTLEGQLRSFLTIPPATDCLFERYSDSAASYVTLDPNNNSVYKQLYRAAKAKQKLKLRVTAKADPVKETKGPRPVTVEDEVESPQTSPSASRPAAQVEKTAISRPTSSAAPVPPPAQQAPPASSFLPPPSSALRRSLAIVEREQKEMERNLDLLGASVAKLNIKPSDYIPVPSICLPMKACGTTGSVRVPVPVQTPRVTHVSAPRPTFAVCCNSCDRTIPESHYHCSTCDDGDFDLCQDCVDKGITCYGKDHWLIKRAIKNGTIVNSTTERLPPKPKPKPREVVEEKAPAFRPVALPGYPRVSTIYGGCAFSSSRTCNCCVQELPEAEFVHCTSCDDFDLCKACFVKDQHGHHPKHGFVPAVEGTALDRDVSRRLPAGRGQKHNAVCDGCDKFISGVRHKCLECPDWDYCGSCVLNANFIHPGHRFVQIYEALPDARIRLASRPVHVGIFCDGPLCSASSTTRGGTRYIVGDRFKCAVCHDTDFCSNCEASPGNTHNKTHPLIKFKTPVRHVSVTTSGEHMDGQRMPAMGDRILRHQPSTSSRATETTLTNAFMTAVQTVVDVQPSGSSMPPKVEQVETGADVKEKAPAVENASPAAPPSVDLSELMDAAYVRDTVADGTVMSPNHMFEQTWVLRNSGPVDWPAGCFVKFIGGDYMGSVDPSHPADVSELVSAAQSTICNAPVAPGQEQAFSVYLRTPARAGKFISYWRLTTDDGKRFGHKLWCDVSVQVPKIVEMPQENPKEPVSGAVAYAASESDKGSSSTESQMIFPKLEKESPSASIHEQTELDDAPAVPADEGTGDFDDCEDDEWADESDDGLVTDEEYDILDASDEEYLEEQQKLLKK